MKYFLCFLFVISISVSNAQIANSKRYSEVKVQYFSKGVDLTSFLPKRHSKSGNVDYTAFLQQGINKHDLVILPNFPIMINEAGLKLRSNQKVLFQESSKLIMKSNSEKRNSILNLSGVQNVSVYFANIEGDKYRHLSKEGQWGMGFYILGSKNVLIESARIVKCWGDGICIGGLNGVNSKDITIKNSTLDDNRRNGISIITGENILVSNTLIMNTSGHNPQAGIDIEPDNSRYELRNVLLKNIRTRNNGNFGIVVSPGNIEGEVAKSISITIDGFSDDGSTNGLAFQIARENQKYHLKPIHGTIVVKNFTSRNNKVSKFRNYTGKKHNVNVSIDFQGLNKTAVENRQSIKSLSANSNFAIR